MPCARGPPSCWLAGLRVLWLQLQLLIFAFAHLLGVDEYLEPSDWFGAG